MLRYKKDARTHFVLFAITPRSDATIFAFGLVDDSLIHPPTSARARAGKRPCLRPSPRTLTNRKMNASKDSILPDNLGLNDSVPEIFGGRPLPRILLCLRWLGSHH